MNDIQAGQRKVALDKLNAGDAAGAAALLKKMLAGDADNADLLGLLGIAQEESGDKDAGAEALRRAIALPAEPSIELRNASNLAALLFDSGKREDAAELLRQGWRWRGDDAPDARELSCIALLARMMSALKLNDALVTLLLPIARSSQLDWPCLQDLARALAAEGRPREAVQLVEEGSGPDEQVGERDALRAFLLWKAGDVAAAAKARDAYIAKTPAFLTAAQPKQRFTIGVINEAPSGDQLTGPIAAHHFHLNFPSQLARKFADRYRFASVFAGAGPNAITQFCAFEPRVVISNLGNPEILRSDQKLPIAQHLAEAPGVPLINAPECVAQCTRQLNAIRLKHLPNAVVPKISRFKRDLKRLDELAREIERTFAYPMIVRTVADQHAINMIRAETPAELRAALTQLNAPELYVADYVGAPRREGLHRRLRAAFIDGTPIVLWADYAAQWIVQSRRWDYVCATYRNRPDLLADADEFISRPAERLGAAAMATLDQIGRLIPIDIFGLDFDVDDQGRVVFFEANPAMNLLSKAPPELAYPAQAQAAVLDHLEQLFERRASQPKQALRLNA